MSGTGVEPGVALPRDHGEKEQKNQSPHSSNDLLYGSCNECSAMDDPVTQNVRSQTAAADPVPDDLSGRHAFGTRQPPRIVQGSQSSTPRSLTSPTMNSFPTSSFNRTPLVMRFLRVRDRSGQRSCSEKNNSISSASTKVMFCPG